MKKRIVSIMLALAVALCFVPYSIFADDNVGGISDNDPVYFTAIDGTQTSDSEGWAKLFDGDTSTKWCVGRESFSNAYVVFEATERVIVTGYTLTTGNDTGDYEGRNPTAWTLYGSNDCYDDDSWVALASRTESDPELPAESLATQSYTVSGNSTYYNYYKLEITAVKEGGIMQLSEMTLTYTQCEHTWSDFNGESAATCTEGAYKTRTCSGDCHSTQKVYVSQATGHDFDGSDTAKCLHEGCEVTAADYFSGWKKMTNEQLNLYDGKYFSRSNKYYLAEDITLTQVISTIDYIGNEKIVEPVLDLNGHVLKYDGDSTDAVIEISGMGLTIQDSSPSVEHKFKVEEDGLYVLDETNGTVTLKGGCITRTNASDDRGAIICQNGCSGDGTIITINGGNIVGGKTTSEETASVGGLYLCGSSTKFTMNGGCIIGCTVSGNGYADALCFGWVKGEIIMNGGEIHGKTYIIRSCAVKNDNLFGTATHYFGEVKADDTENIYSGIFYGDITNIPSKVSGNKITFKKLDDTVYATEIVATGKTVAEPLNLTDSAIVWNTADGEVFDFSSTRISGDITLYAGTPTFYKVSYINYNNVEKEEYVLAGQKLTLPTDISSIGDDSEIIGWIIGYNGTTEWNFDTDTVQSAVDLYARYRSITGPTIELLEDNKTYSCGTNVEFYIDGGDITSVMAGTTALTPDADNHYWIVAGSGTVTITVTDEWDRTDTKTITVNAAHDFGTNYEHSSTEHWQVCATCGDDSNHAAHTPDYDEATYEHAKKCSVCEYEIAPKLVDNEDPVITGLENNKKYTCGTNVKFTVTDNGVLDSVMAGSTTLTADADGYYTLTAVGTVTVTAKDKAGNETTVTITLNAAHDFSGAYKTNANEHWHECATCGEAETHTAHTPDRNAATYDDPISCSVCSYVIAPKLNRVIDRINVAVTPPSPGKYVSYYYDEGPTFVSDMPNGLELDGFMWFYLDKNYYTGSDHDSWQILYSSDGVFECGYYYMCLIGLETLDGYEISEDVVCRINGQPNNEMLFYGQGLSEHYVYLSIVFDPLETSSEYVVTEAKATVTAPVLGAKPDWKPIIKLTPKEALDFGEVEIFWYKTDKDSFMGTSYDSWTQMAEDEVFEDGYIYSVDIYVYLYEYIVSPDIIGTINGKYSYTNYGGVYDEDNIDGIYLSLTFDDWQDITSVAATVTAPALNANPNNAAEIVTTPANALYGYNNVYWGKISVSGYFAINGNVQSSYWDPMSTDETFKSGYYYACIIEIAGNSGYNFAPSTVYTINGETAGIFESTYSKYMYFVFKPLSATATSAPQLKFTLNGYELGNKIGDITVTPDSGNIGFVFDEDTNKYLNCFAITTNCFSYNSAMGAVIDDENAVFGEQKYYMFMCLLCSDLQDGYSFEAVTTDNFELEGHGKAKLVYYYSDGSGSSYDCVYVVFELSSLYEKQMTVSFTKKVTLGDIAAPGKTTFELEIFDLDNTLWLYYPDIEFTATVETNGKGEYESTIVITGPAAQLEAFLENNAGFYVREKKGNAEEWTYSDEVYYVELEAAAETAADNSSSTDTDDDSTVTTIATTASIYKVKKNYEDDGSFEYEIDDSATVDAMVFENIYTSDSPETGDESNIVLWIALLMLSGMLLVATGLYSGKKRRA